MPTPNATLFDPVTPNFRDLAAERIDAVFAIIGATAAQGTAAVSLADADPATLGLRRAFHSALAMRLRMLKTKLRTAVIQHDLLGLGGTNIAAMVQRDADRLAAFNRWLGITTSQVMSGIWLEAAVTRAWIAGRENATSEVGAAVYAPTPASATASARTELASRLCQPHHHGDLPARQGRNLSSRWGEDSRSVIALATARGQRNEAEDDLVSIWRQGR